MNPMNKKALILSIPMILAILLLGGWFLLREQKMAQESQNTPIIGENPPTTNTGNIEPSANVDISKWKTYRNEEFGFELKYQEGYTIILQPGSNKTLGTLFVVNNEEYRDLQKDDSFEKNPMIALSKNGSVKSFEVEWNANAWIVDAFKSQSSSEALQKIILGNSPYTTYSGKEYKLSLPTFQRVANTNGKQIYEYKFLGENVKNANDTYGHGGFAWEEKGVFVQAQSITTLDTDLKKSAFQTALSFKTL